MAFTIHGTTDPLTSALHIILGHIVGVDLLAVHADNCLQRFVVSMLSYGYLGDVMKHSERLRWLGRKRYEVSGVKTFLTLKAYEGTVRWALKPQKNT